MEFASYLNTYGFLVLGSLLIVFNLPVLAVVGLSKELRTQYGVLIISLFNGFLSGAVSIAYGVFRLSLIWNGTDNELISVEQCFYNPINLLLLWTFPMCGLGLLLQSIDRFIVVCFPLKYFHHNSKVTTVLNVLAIVVNTVVVVAVCISALRQPHFSVNILCNNKEMFSQEMLIFLIASRTVFALLSVLLMFVVLILITKHNRKGTKNFLSDATLNHFKSRQMKYTNTMLISCIATILVFILPSMFAIVAVLLDLPRQVTTWIRFVNYLDSFNIAFLLIHRQQMMDVPPGPSCRRSTSAASLLNMAADLEAQAASEIVGMFRDVVNTMTHERFSVVDRTLVMCSLKCLIGGYLSFDEYAQNLRRVIGEHPCVSEEARQFVDAALPTLRQRMRAANFFVNDVSVNQEFGVFQHFIDQEGHAVVALFATGMAECMFAIQDNVHVVCQNIINRTHEVQAVNPALTSHEPKIAPRPPGSKVFRNLLVAVNEVSLPTMELSSMIAHLKCLIVGLIESRKFFQTLEPLLAKLAFSFPSIEMVMLPHLLDGAIPSLRRAMEIEDVIVDGCNINRELGVLVHDPHGAPLALLMVGNTESRLGIAEEVRNIVCHLMKSVVRRPRVSPKASNGSSSNGLIIAKDAPTASTASPRDGKELDVSIGEDSESVTTKMNKVQVSDTNNNNTPSRARRNSVRNRSTLWKERTKPRCSMTGSSQETQVNAMNDSPEELITKCARMFRDVLYTVLDPNNGYDEGVQRTTLSYVKRVISGLMESDMFVVRIGQLLGEGCPFVVEPNSARRIISRMSLFMRDQELVVDGFNLNQEAGVFVHVIDEMGIQRMYVMCEGLIEKANQIYVDVTDM
ncbi:hypothetical protein QR680_015731 [Steinernema hermaphroditum]|uniref:G-protein coupled receptors family 1 profile domain-containing protein n=1 Tax=Steinernema hermaphroditum TaxID=289476 RepID=A0AA39H9U8_9BILA|nr:hypothetical protein QR680_015731 [Steinernema hermaphroditum]